MASPVGKQEWQRALVTLAAVSVTVTVVAAMYWARSIFVPLALAIFFTFVLSPPVRYLQRKGVGRGLSVILVVATAAGMFGLTVWVIGSQIVSLSGTLPENEQRIHAKINQVKGWVSGDDSSRFSRFLTSVQDVISASPQAAAEAAASAAGTGSGPPGPLGTDAGKTVVVQAAQAGWATRAEALATPLLELVGQAAFAFVLVIFMLLKREDLRNRLLRLLGRNRVTTATKAVDDASRRVSRYLLTQLLLNAGFGLVCSVGLMLMGVDYALLWGFLATLMRYVPYIGTWVGVIPPMLYSFAVSDGLWQPAAVFALFIGLETVCNNVLEPWLYGTSLGVSEVAQLVSAGFWTFLWGPIGLILSGPLTTCLLVLGKYAPQFHFLEVLLGDEPPLEPSVAFFQRLTARDQDEAGRILTKAVKDHGPVTAFETVVVPALTLTRTAVAEETLDDADVRAIHAMARELIDDLETPDRSASDPGTEPPVRVLFCPAKDDSDQLVLELLARMLDPDRWEVRVSAEETLTAELLTEVAEFDPALVCVGALPPGGLAHSRYLCKRLRGRYPALKLAIGRWDAADGTEEARQEMQDITVDAVWTSLAAAEQQLNGWLPMLRAGQTEAVGTGAA